MTPPRVHLPVLINFSSTVVSVDSKRGSESSKFGQA
jgi:hypothetical protein